MLIGHLLVMKTGDQGHLSKRNISRTMHVEKQPVASTHCQHVCVMHDVIGCYVSEFFQNHLT